MREEQSDVSEIRLYAFALTLWVAVVPSHSHRPYQRRPVEDHNNSRCGSWSTVRSIWKEDSLPHLTLTPNTQSPSKTPNSPYPIKTHYQAQPPRIRNTQAKRSGLLKMRSHASALTLTSTTHTLSSRHQRLSRSSHTYSWRGLRTLFRNGEGPTDGHAIVILQMRELLVMKGFVKVQNDLNKMRRRAQAITLLHNRFATSTPSIFFVVSRAVLFGSSLVMVVGPPLRLSAAR